MCVQTLVEDAVADEDVGLQVQRQAQGVEVAGADGGPFLIDHRDLAMQRSFAVLEDTHAGLEQMLIQRGGGGARDGHIRAPLQHQAHVHAPPRRQAQLSHQAVAGEEVGVGNHHAQLRRADGVAVMALDVVGVVQVVSHDEACLRAAFPGQLRRQDAR